MNIDEISRILLPIATAGAIIKLIIEGIIGIKKHEILSKYRNVVINTLSFAFVISAAISYYIFKSYKYAVILFFITWLIESMLFLIKKEQPSRYEIWMMIYQTGVLSLLLLIYFVILIVDVLKTL